MNIRYSFFAPIITVIFSSIGYGQGTFQNLDFEQAAPIIASGFNPADEVTAASALPDWVVTIAGVEKANILYNDIGTGSPEVDLLGPGSPLGLSTINGNYSVLLQGTFGSGDISQTGLIPNGTQSLIFDGRPGFTPLDVFIGGQPVAYAIVGTGPNYNIYGANISPWSGKTEQLTFSAPVASGNWEIDNIAFSPNPITVAPEPDAFFLLSLGGIAFGLYRRIQVGRK